MSASAWPSDASLISARPIAGSAALRRLVARQQSGNEHRRRRVAAVALVQPEHAVDGAQFGRLDQLGMRNGDSEQRAFELFLPEGEKVLQRREIREQIVI